MASKKIAKKTTESLPQAEAVPAKPAARKAAKKAAARKTAAAEPAPAPAATSAAPAPAASPAIKAAAPAKKAVAAKKAGKPSPDELAHAAYLNYRRRVEQGLPGDSHGDWLEAERQLGGGSK